MLAEDEDGQLQGVLNLHSRRRSDLQPTQERQAAEFEVRSGIFPVLGRLSPFSQLKTQCDALAYELGKQPDKSLPAADQFTFATAHHLLRQRSVAQTLALGDPSPTGLSRGEPPRLVQGSWKARRGRLRHGVPSTAQVLSSQSCSKNHEQSINLAHLRPKRSRVSGVGGPARVHHDALHEHPRARRNFPRPRQLLRSVQIHAGR